MRAAGISNERIDGVLKSCSLLPPDQPALTLRRFAEALATIEFDARLVEINADQLRRV
jgi:hypothetical protein